MKGCFLEAKGSDRVDFVFSHGRKERFAQLLELCPQVIHPRGFGRKPGLPAGGRGGAVYLEICSP